MRRDYVEGQNATEVDVGFQMIHPSTQSAFPFGFDQPFDAIPQFSQHRRTEVDRTRRLGVEPRSNFHAGFLTNTLRYNVGVQQDHSKSGGSALLPGYLKTRSSPRSSGRIRSNISEPNPRFRLGSISPFRISAFASSDKL